MDLSVKMRNLSFCCAALIVLHHANATFVMTPTWWNVGVHDFFCNQLAFWAVRFFFVMSGFWFVRGHYFRTGDYLAFLKSKFSSLVVPYLAFAVFGMLAATVLILVHNILAEKPIISGTIFSSESLWAAMDRTFGLSAEPKWNGALWYVRALFIIMLFAPVWRWLSRRVLGVLLVAWVILSFMKVELLNIRLCQSCYFLLGMVIGRREWEMLKIANSFGWMLLIVWITSGLGLSIAKSCRLNGGEFLFYMENVRFALSVPVVWWAYDYFRFSRLRLPRFVLSCSFFVYCTHVVGLTLLGCPVRWILGKSDFASLLLTPYSFLSVLLFCCGSAYLLNKYSPTCYSILTGGRSRRHVGIQNNKQFGCHAN